MGDINSDILEARKSLRKLYEKYTKELHEVVLKIDKFLENLEVRENDN